MLAQGPNPDLPAQREVLNAIVPQVQEFMQRHRDSRKLWMPADLLPADEQNDVAHDEELNQLRTRVRGLLRAVVRLSPPDRMRRFALALLTRVRPHRSRHLRRPATISGLPWAGADSQFQAT